MRGWPKTAAWGKIAQMAEGANLEKELLDRCFSGALPDPKSRAKRFSVLENSLQCPTLDVDRDGPFGTSGQT